MKYCLGTVQFGLKYGVASSVHPTEKDSINIIDCAIDNGINCLDTAAAYGNAEEIIGKYLKSNPLKRDKIRIATKTLPYVFDGIDPKDYDKILKAEILKSIKKLNCEYLDYYMFHTGNDIFDEKKVESIKKLEKSGLVKSVGASIYSSEEAIHFVENEKLNCVQLPYNAIDRRLDKSNFFNLAIEKNKIVFCRSIFLQGLLTMNPNNLPQNMKFAEKTLIQYDSLCEKYHVSKIAFALAYMKHKKGIDYVVFGVDSIEQLKQQIDLQNMVLPKEAITEADHIFIDTNEKILNPQLWGA